MSFFNNNNNNNNSGFGGGGSSFGNAGGFGANNNAAGASSLFGGGNNNNNNNVSTGFGGSTGGFGASQNNSLSMFGGQKTGFGQTPAATGTGIFGGGNNNNNTTTTGGFGGNGFGATQNSGFGASTSGGLFGQNKPATGGFGTTGTGSIFGGGNTATSGFGGTANNTSNPFGGASTTSGFGGNTTNAATSSFGGFGGAAAASNNSGTGSVPFNAFVEKDVGGANANQMSHYQSITFQDPYKQKSFEELRVEDYLQGRQYGNNNGQAGGFGTSGFGGGNTNPFGGNANAGGSAFGANNNNVTTGFGGSGFGSTANNNTTTSGFGGTTGNSLFGGNKPATSLFGQPQQNAQTTGFGASTTGSAFGGGGGFGTNNNNNTTTTGNSLFGGNNNNNANKPAGFGFGTSSTTTGFGASTQPATSLFGGAQQNTTGNSLFGGNNNNAQTQPQQSSLFGQPANNQTGNSLFGQAKPATSLFGGAQTQPAAGNSLFGGATAQQNTGNSLFGGNNNNTPNSGNSLFGQPKPANSLFGGSQPAAQGNSLFGGASNQTQGNSLFGGNNNNNTQGNSLFGQNKPATGSLFGGGNTSTNSLFGGAQNNTQTSSLFGGGLGNNNNAAAQNTSSLFGGSTNNTPNAQNQLQASLTQAPYGNEQLFSSLNSTAPNVGPLATPLTGAKSAHIRTPSLLASTRINSPVYTPRASGSFGPSGGYGFSYSTYGTPGSAYSVSLTPGASSLLKPTGSLSSGLTSRLAKSVSMNSLRGDSTPRESESLLRPTPGSASSRYLQTGNMRKLNIDRSLRADLFSPLSTETKQSDVVRENDDSALRKKVSFDNHVQTNGQSVAEPNSSNALIRRKSDDEHEDAPTTNGNTVEKQTNGSSLSTVPEDSVPPRSASAPPAKPSADKSKSGDVEAGEYWTKPAIKDLKKMSRAQLSKLGGFTVGREGVGHIDFGPCDLTNTDLDAICGDIVQLTVRQATVYQDERTKPARGKALNVPSTIYLENSWPRSNGGKKPAAASGPAYDRHVARLRRIEGTEFKSYDPATGVWCFTVQHYTTYGLDDDDEEDVTEAMHEDSPAKQAPSTPPGPEDVTMQSFEMPSGVEDMDDTFHFKTAKRSVSSLPGKHVPGGFGDQSMMVEEEDRHSIVDSDDEHMMSGHGEMEDPFTSPGGAVQAPSPGAYERHQSSMMLDEDTHAIDIAEDEQADLEPELPGSYIPEQPKMLRSILKPPAPRFPSPEKLVTESWTEQLQRTMSPAKRDRQALKELQQGIFQAPQDDPFDSPFKRSILGHSMLGQSYLAQKSAKKVGFGASVQKSTSKPDLAKSQAFQTSMDIMNSLWTQDKSSKQTALTKGFEIPYSKKPRLSASDTLSTQDAAFHNTVKPGFATNRDILLYSATPAAGQVNGEFSRALRPVSGTDAEIRFAQWTPQADLNTPSLTLQKDNTQVEDDGFTFMQTTADVSFRQYTENAASSAEHSIWRLASVLYDDVPVACDGLIDGMSPQLVAQQEKRLRIDAFSLFWVDAVRSIAEKQLKDAKTAEEKALIYLTLNDIVAASEVLVAAKDFKLATLVAQLPLAEESKELMRGQITVWKERNDWSEMSDAIRALYSILAGQICTVEGKTGAAENRASQFCITERFGLSWMQTFGLRVFFGGYISLREATTAYVNDLKDGHETVRPVPWWSHEEDREDREDALLSLLRSIGPSSNIEALLDAKTISGVNGNSRVAWQLATNLYARGVRISEIILDQLTISFSSELERTGSFVTAAWVLLHLRSDPTHRETAIQSLLTRNATLISEPTAPADDQQPPSSFDLLTTQCAIPASHLWHAKSLAARAVNSDPALQAQWLLNAHAVPEAHAILCADVGPTAILEQDYDDLAHLLAAFNSVSVDGGDAEAIVGADAWRAGAQVYADFVQLATLGGAERAKVAEGLMRRLDSGLRVLEERGEKALALEEWVAIVEMRAMLEGWVREWNASPFGAERLVLGREDGEMGGKGGLKGAGKGKGKGGKGKKGAAGSEAMKTGRDDVNVGLGAFERYKRAMDVVA